MSANWLSFSPDILGLNNILQHFDWRQRDTSILDEPICPLKLERVLEMETYDGTLLPLINLNNEIGIRVNQLNCYAEWFLEETTHHCVLLKTLVTTKSDWEQPLTLWLHKYALARKEYYFISAGVLSFTCHHTESWNDVKRKIVRSYELFEENVVSMFKSCSNTLAVCSIDGIAHEIRCYRESINVSPFCLGLSFLLPHTFGFLFFRMKYSVTSWTQLTPRTTCTV